MTESAPRVGWSTPDPQGDNGQSEGARVRHHVSCLGKQGDRVGKKAAYCLDQREAAQDQERKKQATLACFLGVMMTVMVAATLVMMVMAMTVTLQVVVIAPAVM